MVCQRCKIQVWNESAIQTVFGKPSSECKGVILCHRCGNRESQMSGKKRYVLRDGKWKWLSYPSKHHLSLQQWRDCIQLKEKGHLVFLTDGEKVWNWLSHVWMSKGTFESIYGSWEWLPTEENEKVMIVGREIV